MENNNVSQFPRIRRCEDVEASTAELQKLVSLLIKSEIDPRSEIMQVEDEHRRGMCFVRFTTWLGVVRPNCLEEGCGDYLC